MEEIDDIGISGAPVADTGEEFKRWSVSSEDVVLLISKILDGYMIVGSTPTGELKLEKVGEPLVRGKLKQLVIQTISTLIQKHSLMSNLTDKEIYDLTRAIHLRLAELFFLYYDGQNLRNPEELTLICSVVSSVIFMSLKRAKNGETWKGLTTITQTIERVNREAKEDKGSFILGLRGGESG